VGCLVPTRGCWRCGPTFESWGRNLRLNHIPSNPQTPNLRSPRPKMTLLTQPPQTQTPNLKLRTPNPPKHLPRILTVSSTVRKHRHAPTSTPAPHTPNPTLQGLLGPVDPSVRAFSGRLGLTVRRPKFSKDSLSSNPESNPQDSGGVLESAKGLPTASFNCLDESWSDASDQLLPISEVNPSPATALCAAREASKVVQPLAPPSTTNPITPCSP
jgi:hypothetical protein